jgi:hypothetical protein
MLENGLIEKPEIARKVPEQPQEMLESSGRLSWCTQCGGEYATNVELSSGNCEQCGAPLVDDVHLQGMMAGFVTELKQWLYPLRRPQS